MGGKIKKETSPMDFLEAFVGSLGFSQKCLRDWKHFFEFLNIVGESAEIAEA